ncbi:MAG: hypothetical protein IT371_28705 [Deltaproteobacteria bacterium]|nr:hypothetical protein [Deltaproteobacteria bacterium]
MRRASHSLLRFGLALLLALPWLASSAEARRSASNQRSAGATRAANRYLQGAGENARLSLTAYGAKNKVTGRLADGTRVQLKFDGQGNLVSLRKGDVLLEGAGLPARSGPGADPIVTAARNLLGKAKATGSEIVKLGAALDGDKGRVVIDDGKHLVGRTLGKEGKSAAATTVQKGGTPTGASRLVAALAAAGSQAPIQQEVRREDATPALRGESKRRHRGRKHARKGSALAVESGTRLQGEGVVGQAVQAIQPVQAVQVTAPARLAVRAKVSAPSDKGTRLTASGTAAERAAVALRGLRGSQADAQLTLNARREGDKIVVQHEGGQTYAFAIEGTKLTPPGGRGKDALFRAARELAKRLQATTVTEAQLVAYNNRDGDVVEIADARGVSVRTYHAESGALAFSGRLEGEKLRAYRVGPREKKD